MVRGLGLTLLTTVTLAAAGVIGSNSDGAAQSTQIAQQQKSTPAAKPAPAARSIPPSFSPSPKAASAAVGMFPKNWCPYSSAPCAMDAKSKPCSMTWARHCSSSIGSNGLTNRRPKARNTIG